MLSCNIGNYLIKRYTFSSRVLRAFPFSRIFVEFSLKPVYPIIVSEKFQIFLVQITGKCIHREISNLDLFTLSLRRKTIPQSVSSSLREGEIIHTQSKKGEKETIYSP